MTQPGETYAIARREIRYILTDTLDPANYLMSGDHSRGAQSEVALDHVKVGSADSARRHLDERLGGPLYRSRKVNQPERAFFCRSRPLQDPRLHLQHYRALGANLDLR